VVAAEMSFGASSAIAVSAARAMEALETAIRRARTSARIFFILFCLLEKE
jgi:hypothetical protein